MPRTTSFTSAPTASLTAAMAFTKLILVARKAFEACLMISAEAGSVTWSGAASPRYKAASRTAAAWSSAPITTRSGCRKSCTADPSRRNSGIETTWMSLRPITCSMIRVDPTGTVDALTTIVSGARWGPISAATASSDLRSEGPSGPSGPDTHRYTNSVSATASADPTLKRSRPRPMPSRSSAPSPTSRMGTSPPERRLIRSASMSVQVTSWPRWAKPTPMVMPT
jgi:hypothetical protein